MTGSLPRQLVAAKLIAKGERERGAILCRPTYELINRLSFLDWLAGSLGAGG